MSQNYYQELWRDTQEDLKKTTTLDATIKKKGPVKEMVTAKRLVGHLFMNYVRIVNKLDQCYDQMFHPQKREVIGRLLDTSLGRLLELKAEIVRLEMDDYYYFDDVLIELKLTHQDMEIQVPQYYWRDKEKEKVHRRTLMKKVFAEAEKELFRQAYLKNVPEEDREKVWEKYLHNEEVERLERERLEEQQKKMMGFSLKPLNSLENLKKQLKKEEEARESPRESITQAISLIQRHERARQGRVLAVHIKMSYIIKLREDPSMAINKKVANKAAKVIQRHWRRYRRRAREAKKEDIVCGFLGMTVPSFKDNKKFEKLRRNEILRRKIQERNQKEYEEGLMMIKEKVTSLYSKRMEEDFVEEIRAWFQWFFEKTGFFPDYPPENPLIPTDEILGIPKKLGPAFAAKAFPQTEAKVREKVQENSLARALAGITAIGGSALVVADHWINPNEFLVCQKELEKMSKAGKAEVKKEEPLSKEEIDELKKKAKEEENKRLLAEAAAGFQLKDSNYLVPLNKADRDYRVYWMDLDERKNYDQKYVEDYVKDQKCWELSMEVRKLVDEMMVLELEQFKDALWRDQNPKKKQKKKKQKHPKKKPNKKKKDPTGDRTLDDLFMELFRNGIIRDYEEVYLKNFMGERSFAAFDFRSKNQDLPPSMGDVRDLILQLCILPLGSTTLHQLSPLIRSVLLLGSPNSGKEYLSRVICSETSAVMFDLTPENVAGKYTGKEGLKMLQHLIEKMSRALQPSVIFIEKTEKTFYKKVPKEEKEIDPKRLSGVISKIVKGIKPVDQVLVLGTCSQPWVANKSKLIKTYQKIILVPQMDYGSYVKVWQSLLTPYHCIPRNFDVSCLARASNGYSVNNILEAVRNVMTFKRIRVSQFKPVRQMEFLEELLKNPPQDQKTVEKCIGFYKKTELPKKRAKRLQAIQEVKERATKKVS